MVSALLCCSALLGAPTPEDRANYEAAKAEAGRDADAHIRLALWCEQRGLTVERTRHLALAVLNDPKNAAARSLMGFVQNQGGWRRPEEIVAKVKADAEHSAKMAEYSVKRATALHKPDDQWKLALWCEGNGLKAEATAHLWATVRLDPSREAAWKRLGFKKYEGRWITDAQCVEQKALAQRVDSAQRHWKPLLTKWRGWLTDEKHRATAETALASVTDPFAVPSVCSVFATGGPARQSVAVRLLGQIDSPPSSRALALLAVFGETAEVRRPATETLKRRDPREVAPVLVGLVCDQIKYQVRPVNGPGSANGLFIETKSANLARRYVPTLPHIPLAANDTVFPDEFGLPVIYHPVQTRVTATGPGILANLDAQIQFNQMLAHSLGSMLGSAAPGLGDRLAANMTSGLVAERTSAAQRLQHPTTTMTARGLLPSGLGQTRIIYDQIYVGQMLAQASINAAALVEARIANDVQAIEQYNASIAALNARTVPVLSQISGQDFGENREAWQRWSVDLAGYALRTPDAPSTPTFVEEIPVSVSAPPTVSVNVMDGPVASIPSHSCFGGGTPVHTLLGLRPIEAIRPGDQVLTRDTKTGALRYQPVVSAYHNPPSATLRVRIGDEVIVATGIHRFWKAGHGWIMARDLQTADAVRTLSGTVAVDVVEKGAVQPVFNLEVADGQSFLIGKLGVLVHDNSLVDPVSDPFDAAPELTATAATTR
jgi:hypothetical protein